MVVLLFGESWGRRGRADWEVALMYALRLMLMLKFVLENLVQCMFLYRIYGQKVAPCSQSIFEVFALLEATIQIFRCSPY